MNSSISGSDASRWRRWLGGYAAASVALGLLFAAAILALDPYDTGRFALVPDIGVPDFGQRLAFAGLARQPQFDTAILGNSTIQLIDPARVSSMSGRKVISLAVPGTGPLEQLAIAGWFVRHHPARRLDLIFGLDESWCTTQAPIPLTNPFPFWLYADSRIDYAVNMLRYRSIEAAWRKAKLLLGRERVAQADGYHDYDTGHEWQKSIIVEAEAAGPSAAESAPGALTAVPRLARFLAGIDPATGVLLVFVPRHWRALPAPGTAAAAREAACKSAYRGLAAARAHTAVLDFLVDDAMARDDENFWDRVHYRGPVARVIEQRLAGALDR